MKKKNLANHLKSIFTIVVLTSICIGQTGAGGSVGIFGAGGKAEGALTAKLSTAINKKVFTKLKTVSQNPSSRIKKSTPKQTRPSAVAKSSPKNKPSTNSTSAQTSTNSVFNFRPVGNTGIDRTLAELISPKPEEQEIFLLIFRETKKAYQAEALKLNRQNDLALSLTFFMATCLTVYHDAPEPSDLATDNLYLMLAESMVETPEITKLSNQEKYMTSDLLVYISGLILAGYMSSKESNDAETLAIYQKTAGECLQSLMGISPENVYFEGDNLKIIE